MSSSKRKLPSSVCVSCHKPIEEIGGRRIIRSNKGGVVLLNDSSYFPLKNLKTTHAFIYNIPNDPRLIFFWGTYVKHLYSCITSVVEDIVHKNRRPWVCQKCVNYALCKHCNEPLVDAPMAEVLNDDGRITHVPSLGVNRPCSKQCGRRG